MYTLYGIPLYHFPYICHKRQELQCRSQGTDECVQFTVTVGLVPFPHPLSWAVWAINQLDEVSERRNRYQHSDKKQSIHLSLLQLENKQHEEDVQDMTSIVFSSRPVTLKHMEGPLAAYTTFHFKNKALHVVTTVFKTVIWMLHFSCEKKRLLVNEMQEHSLFKFIFTSQCVSKLVAVCPNGFWCLD